MSDKDYIASELISCTRMLHEKQQQALRLQEFISLIHAYMCTEQQMTKGQFNCAFSWLIHEPTMSPFECIRKGFELV